MPKKYRFGTDQKAAKAEFEDMTTPAEGAAPVAPPADLPPESEMPAAPPVVEVQPQLVEVARAHRPKREDFEPHWPDSPCADARVGQVVIGAKKASLTLTMKDSEGHADLPAIAPVATTSAASNGKLTVRFGGDKLDLDGVVMTYHHNRQTGVVRAKFVRDAGFDMGELKFLNTYKRLKEGERLDASWEAGAQKAPLFDGDDDGGE